jgi:hypothetical protein
LDLRAGAAYNELTAETSPGFGTFRVLVNNPASSPVLRIPTESGLSHTGGVLMSTTNDTNYDTILTWIQEDALDN